MEGQPASRDLEIAHRDRIVLEEDQTGAGEAAVTGAQVVGAHPVAALRVDRGRDLPVVEQSPARHEVEEPLRLTLSPEDPWGLVAGDRRATHLLAIRPGTAIAHHVRDGTGIPLHEVRGDDLVLDDRSERVT